MSYEFDNSGRPVPRQPTNTTRNSSNITQLPVDIFPTKAIPIVFLPGILGSPLRSRNAEARQAMYAQNPWAWFPDFPYGWVGGFHPKRNTYSDLSPAQRKRLLDPLTAEALHPDDQDIEREMIQRISIKLGWPFINKLLNERQLPTIRYLSVQEALRRGWATVYWSGYGTMLSTLEKSLRYLTYHPDPDSDETVSTRQYDNLAPPIYNALKTMLEVEDKKFHPALQQTFPQVDPKSAKAGMYTDHLKPFIKKARQYNYPVFAVGYNWLESNAVSADKVYERIQEIIKYVERQPDSKIPETTGLRPPARGSGGLGWRCEDGVILLTHSMGGLVGRSLAKKHPDIIRGVLHNVQPCNGSATLYARMKAGWEGGMAGKALAETGAHLMPVLTQSAGATELSPNQNYEAGWLRIFNVANGQVLDTFPKPGENGKCDPYRDIYLQKNVWWKLGEPALIDPEPAPGVTEEKIWEGYERVVRGAKKFHEDIDNHFHANTYLQYGNSDKHRTWGTVDWLVGFYNSDKPRQRYDNYSHEQVKKLLDTGGLTHPVRSGNLGAGQMDLLNNTHLPGQPKAYIRAAGTDGDGTVPFNSANPWQAQGNVWESGAATSNPMPTNVPESIKYIFEFREKPFDHAESYDPDNVLNTAFYTLLNIVGK